MFYHTSKNQSFGLVSCRRVHPSVIVHSTECTDRNTSDDVQDSEIEISACVVTSTAWFQPLIERVTTWLSEDAHESIQWFESLRFRSPGLHVLNSLGCTTCHESMTESCLSMVDTPAVRKVLNDMWQSDQYTIQ